MRPVLSIARRELKSYFLSPAIYVVTLAFLLMTSLRFLLDLQGHIADVMMAASPMAGGPPPTVTANVLQPLMFPGFASIFFALWFIVPLITMRLLSEDRKQGTTDLLLSSPITTLQLVLGKYIGGLAVLALLMGLTLHMPVILVLLGDADPGVAFAGYLGLFLVGGMFLAAGTLASSLTENQIVSAILSMAMIIALILFGQVAQASEQFLGGVLSPFALGEKISDFIRGILDSSGFIYFISMIAFFLFLTQRIIDSQRWR